MNNSKKLMYFLAFFLRIKFKQHNIKPHSFVPHLLFINWYDRFWTPYSVSVTSMFETQFIKLFFLLSFTTVKNWKYEQLNDPSGNQVLF